LKEVKPYTEHGPGKKVQVTNMFDNIAPYYDLMNRVLSLGIDTIWRKKAIQLASLKQPKLILDIATGTGDLALEAFKQNPESEVIGVDISSNMIDLGKKKVVKKGLTPNISLEVGDSEALRFDSDRFDLVTAAFGVRNFENLNKGLTEMNRVLKSGGEIMVLEFSKPRIFPFKQLFNLYFKNILPVIGSIKSKDPKAYKYLYESVQSFPDYDEFGKELTKAGFSNISYKSLSLGICTIYRGIK